MLESSQTSAVLGRGDLADVGGTDYAGTADREAADEPINHKLHGTGGDAGPPSADSEENRSGKKCSTSAEAVGHTSGKEGACRAPEEHGGHVKTAADIVRVEGLLECSHGSVDDPTIKAKEEAPQGGDSGKQGNPKQMERRVGCHRNDDCFGLFVNIRVTEI